MNRALLSVLVCALVACRIDSEVLAPPKTGSLDTVVLSNGAEPKSIDPGLAEESSGIEIVNNIFEGLTTLAPQTLEPLPGMAERWEQSEDRLRYTFFLRDSKWTDGSPVTAHDFVYAWRRVLSPELGSAYAYQLWYLKNAQAINEGVEKNIETLGVRALDDKTLEVELERPTPFFLYLTAFATYMPVPKATVERWGRFWTQPQHIVSNGAYRLATWKFQDELTFERNEFYWDAANVKIQKIVALTVESDQAVLNLYRTGGVDTTAPNSALPLSAIPSLKKYEEMKKNSILGSYWYWFNVRKPPFDDVRVRRAFAMAIDKQTLVETVLKGQHDPAWSLVPALFDNVTGYRPPLNESDRFDPVEARRLFAEAGFSDPKKFPRVTLLFNTSDGHRLIAEAAQAMWKKHLGVEVRVTNMEWKVLLSELNQGNFDMARSAWIADYPEPSTFLTVFTGSGGQNNSGWTNAEYEALLARALLEPELERRNELYAKAERILLDELPAIPLYRYSKVSLVRPSLRGFTPNAMDLHLWKYLSWDKEGR